LGAIVGGPNKFAPTNEEYKKKAGILSIKA